MVPIFCLLYFLWHTFSPWLSAWYAYNKSTSKGSIFEMSLMRVSSRLFDARVLNCKTNKYQLNDICNVWIPVYYSYYEYTLWQLWIQIGFLYVISEQINHRFIIFEKKDGRWEVKAWETMENQRSWWTKENQCTQKQYT